MQTISNICAVIVGIAMFATPVLFLIWLIKCILKKPSKRIGVATLVSLACFVVFLLVGTFTDPATYCDHEYNLVEQEAATCEKGGYEKYHCDLCGRDKTENLKKLGHDMVDVRRVEPTYDADGEYVRRCTRCGYEGIEVLEKLERPTEKPTEKPAERATEKPTEAQTAPTTAPATKPTEPVQTVTFDEIYRAYKDNELVADDLYQYNRYRVTAEVSDISSSGILNLFGGATLTMKTRVDNTIVFFIAEFEKEQEEALKTIKVGDTITFEGECLSAGTWSDCELITE